jgi:hypothetical protein
MIVEYLFFWSLHRTGRQSVRLEDFQGCGIDILDGG